jgi:hypothetical protein
LHVKVYTDLALSEEVCYLGSYIDVATEVDFTTLSGGNLSFVNYYATNSMYSF